MLHHCKLDTVFGSYTLVSHPSLQALDLPGKAGRAGCEIWAPQHRITAITTLKMWDELTGGWIGQVPLSSQVVTSSPSPEPPALTTCLFCCSKGQDRSSWGLV